MSATLTISDELRSEVATLASDIPPGDNLVLQVVGPGLDAPVPLPSHVTRFIRDVLDSVLTHGSVQVRSTPEIVTTTVAADMLGVSRPTLMKLIRDGSLPSHKVGTHARLLSTDVMTFRARRAAAHEAAFASLRQIDEALDLDD